MRLSWSHKNAVRSGVLGRSAGWSATSLISNSHSSPSMNVSSDCSCVVLILSLPWYPISRLQLPWRRKVSVLGIFALGAIVVAASIARLLALKNSINASSPDVTCECKAIHLIDESRAHCLLSVGRCLCTGFVLERDRSWHWYRGCLSAYLRTLIQGSSPEQLSWTRSRQRCWRNAKQLSSEPPLSRAGLAGSYSKGVGRDLQGSIQLHFRFG